MLIISRPTEPEPLGLQYNPLSDVATTVFTPSTQDEWTFAFDPSNRLAVQGVPRYTETSYNSNANYYNW
jgi:hypothetical protein